MKCQENDEDHKTNVQPRTLTMIELINVPRSIMNNIKLETIGFRRGSITYTF